MEPSSWAALDKSWLKTCFASIPKQTEEAQKKASCPCSKRMGKSGAINMKYEFLKPIFARPGLLPCHSEKLAMGDKCGSDCAYVHPDPQTVLSILQYEVEPMGRFAHFQFRSSKWRKKRNLERIIKAYMNSNVQRSSAGSLLQNNFQTIPIVPKNNHGPLFGSKCQGSSVGNVSSSADFLYKKQRIRHHSAPRLHRSSLQNPLGKSAGLVEIRDARMCI